MSEILKFIIPALLGTAVTLIGVIAVWFTYFASKHFGKRSAQLNYIQTIFQYEAIPRYFSFILWNVHFLSNVSRFFENLIIDDQGVAQIRDNNLHRHIIIEILSYVGVQSADITRKEKKKLDDPPSLDSYLVNTPLVRNRLNNENIVSEFKTSLFSNGDKELRDRLNQFILREKLRMSERASYMSFLLPFACSPEIRKKIISIINDEKISESKRWSLIEEIIEIFLQGNALPKRSRARKET